MEFMSLILIHATGAERLLAILAIQSEVVLMRKTFLRKLVII